MSDSDERVDILRMDGYLLGVATLGLLNGQEFSPAFDGTYILLKPFWPSFLSASPLVLFYLASLVLSVGTVLLGGIGAAVYERAKGLGESTPRSMQLWLLGTFMLTLPAIGRLFRMF